MYEKVEKPKGQKGKAAANSVAQKKNNVNQGFGFVDNRPESIGQAKQATQLMKRSTRMLGLSDYAEHKHEGDSSQTAFSAKKNYTSNATTIPVSIGYLQTTMAGALDEGGKRHNVLEKLLEEIGGNSKGHHLITGDQDKLNIFKQVCKDLKINPEWTGLNF